MNRTSRVSSNQLAVLLTVSRSASLLTRSSAFSVSSSARQTLLGLLISVAAVFLLDLIPAGRDRYRPLDGATALFLSVYLLIAGGHSLLSTVVFIQAETEVVIPAVAAVALIMAAVYYALRCGIEGITRFSFLASVFFFTVLLFTLLFNTSRMNVVNLSASYSGSLRQTGAIAISNTFLNPEIAAYIVLRRFVRKEEEKRHTFLRFFFRSTLVLMVFTVCQELVFGQMTDIQSYPIYSLAIVGEFSIFQRMDIIHLSIWVVDAVVRLSVVGVALMTALSDLLPKIHHTHTGAAIVVCITLGTVLMMGPLSAPPETVETALLCAALLTAVSFAVRGFRLARRRPAAGEENA